MGWRAVLSPSTNDLREYLLPDALEKDPEPRDLRARRGPWSRVWHVTLFITISVLCSVSFYQQHQISVLRGTRTGVDKSGFVPAGVGEPVRGKVFDAEFLREDIFDDIDKMQAAAALMKTLYPASIVYANGTYGKFYGQDGEGGLLAPSKIIPSGNEVYGITGFHQMHCIVAIIEDHGHRIHGYESPWPTSHFIHCLNALYNAVACLADASALGIDESIVRLDLAQQHQCRDWDALRSWGMQPDKRVYLKNIAPAGSVKETLVESFHEW